MPAALASKDQPSGGIPAWHVVISGFTQRLEHPSGSQYLWNSIRLARENCREAACLLEPWNSDWRGIAEWIWRFRPLDRPARVYVYAYSWGGGWGFPQLAKELDERGIEIQHAVLTDPVYRSPRRLLAPLALCPIVPIMVPANVREVSWFFQRTNRFLRGHEPIAADPLRTKINKGVECLGLTHHYMDDSNEWFLRCLRIASQARPAAKYDSPIEKLDKEKHHAR